MKLLEKHFEIALETPDGITRLRELILKLAMQGKLVEQNSDFALARNQLIEIENNKNKLFIEGKIKKKDTYLPIKKEEMPFVLPDNWSWCRLGEISDLITKGSSPTWQGVKYIDNPEVLFVTSENVDTYKVDLTKRKYVEFKFNEIEPRSILQKGDYLMNIVGASIGRTAIYNLDELANINQAVCLIRKSSDFIDDNFLLYFFNSPICISFMYDKQVENARPNLSMGSISKFVIPFPPAEEQKRIVEKIDQLMLLCDKLEAERNRKNKLQLQINSAAINNLITANDEISFNNAWSFITNQFDTLYTVKQNVTDLREVILNLAMRGKLVLQDGKDQSAEALHIEILKEKSTLIKSGSIRKQKELPVVKKDEITYELPKNWKWVRLNDFGTWKSGSTPNRSNSSYYEGNIPWVKSGEVKQGRIKFTSETITGYALEKCSLHINPIGSVLIAMYGANIGEAGVLEIKAATNQAVCACNTFKGIDNNYLYNLLLSLKNNFISQGAGAAQPNISREKIINTVVPLPPLNEQKRIVERINQLFELCDNLEKNIEQSSKKQTQILNAVLAQV